MSLSAKNDNDGKNSELLLMAVDSEDVEIDKGYDIPSNDSVASAQYATNPDEYVQMSNCRYECVLMTESEMTFLKESALLN